jgi:streptogramin lyase
MTERVLPALLALLVVLLAAMPYVPAYSQSGPSVSKSVIHELPLGVSSSQPLGLTTDSQGDVWFAESSTDTIVEYIPSNQTFRQFHIPTGQHTAFIWFLVFDKRGSLWFADSTEPLLWELSPSNGEFENFSLSGSRPFSLAYDAASDRLWFSSTYTNQLGLVKLGSNGAKVIQISSLPSLGYTGVGPAGIALDGIGHLYVAETFAGRIVEYNEDTLAPISSWKLGNTSRPVGIAISGERVWFTDHATSLFGYVSLVTGSIVEFSTPLVTSGGSPIISLPYWIAVSRDGSLWFDEHFGNSIDRFNPNTMQLTDFKLGQDSWPLRLTIDDRHSKVWFTEFGAGRIGWIPENGSEVQQLASPEPVVLNTGVPAVFHLAKLPGFSGPSVTGSLTPDGSIDSNVSVGVSTTAGYYNIAIAPVDVVSGNYTITICISDNPIVQCAVRVLSFHTTASSTYSPELLLVSGIVLAGALGTYLLIKRPRLPFVR